MAYRDVAFSHLIKKICSNQPFFFCKNDPIWNQFLRCSALTKLELQQTHLAFLSPPNQIRSSRYMNVEILVQWGEKVLTFLEQLEPNENAAILAKLGWVIEYRNSIHEWGKMMQIIGLVESQIRNRGYFTGCYDELKQLLPNHKKFKNPSKVVGFCGHPRNESETW